MKAEENFEFNDQKMFYLLYLDKNLDMELKKLIRKFEALIIKYEPPSGKEVGDARKLIQAQFKEFVDKELGIKKLPKI